MSLPLFIIGGAPVSSAFVLESERASSHVVVAVDAGADRCREAGVVPDLVIGDMDSVSAEGATWLAHQGVPVCRLDVSKDESDLEAAMSWAANNDVASIVLTAVSHGRIDHQLAVLGTLAAYADLAPVVVEPCEEMHVLSSRGKADLCVCGAEVPFSILSLTDAALLSIDGAEYDLDRESLAFLSSRGLSNLTRADLTRITVHRGTVLVSVGPRSPMP